MKKDVYGLVTERIVELLEQGVIPWRKPWQPEAGEHRNLISKKAYRGINVFLLGALGYGSPYWLTYKQAQQLGGCVKKGEKGTTVVFWKWLDKKEEDDSGDLKQVKIPMLRYYTVFNVEQTEGIPEEKIPAVEECEENTIQPIEAAAALIDGMPQRPEIGHGGNRAFYSPSRDRVQLPNMEQFDMVEEYYCAAFHELAHATGHSSRLDRKEVTGCNPFSSEDYSKEELVAEMTAAYLCGVTGIEQSTLENSAAYIQGWLKQLKDDRKLVIHAAAAGQKAADFIRHIEQSQVAA